ncbi:MAG: hypothetical protein MUF83_10395 [Acidimicrobiales bacterium]|nr:hypothetical protein [Acidimicrobiales bacterium]
MTQDEHEAAGSLMAKLRLFIRDELDADERALFASLMAPAVAQAFGESGTDVEGFGIVRWRPHLPEALVTELHAEGITVVGLEDPERRPPT